MSEQLLGWVEACDEDEGLYLIHQGGRYLVYCNLIEDDVSYSSIKDADGNWTVTLADTQDDRRRESQKGYALLEVPDCDLITVHCGTQTRQLSNRVRFDWS